MPNDPRSPEEIERDIDRDRARRSSTVDELQERFSPEGVLREASQSLGEYGSDVGRSVGGRMPTRPGTARPAPVGAASRWARAAGWQRRMRPSAADRRRPKPANSRGVASLMQGLNIAHGEDEDRGFFRLLAVKLILTLALIVGVIMGLTATIILPAVLSFLNLSAWAGSLIDLLRWAILLIVTVAGISLLYRFGPSRPPPGLAMADAGRPARRSHGLRRRWAFRPMSRPSAPTTKASARWRASWCC